MELLNYFGQELQPCRFTLNIDMLFWRGAKCAHIKGKLFKCKTKKKFNCRVQRSEVCTPPSPQQTTSLSFLEATSPSARSSPGKCKREKQTPPAEAAITSNYYHLLVSKQQGKQTPQYWQNSSQQAVSYFVCLLTFVFKPLWHLT